MASKDKAKAAYTKKASLAGVLKKNESIKKTVKSAASELASVNDALMQEGAPVEVLEEALSQNEAVEHKVAKAADDLRLVNLKLSEEVAERILVESELATTKTDLAEARGHLSEAQARTEEAQRSALYDRLTELPNRVMFEHGLEYGLSQAKRHGWGLAVLFIDLDDFKAINDSHGHDVGDEVLRTVAARLQSFVRQEDLVSRWGGDEFVCMCLEVKQEADVIRLAEKTIDRLAEAFEVNGTTLSIKASIGIAIYPADGETTAVLFKNADTAMYEAKASTQRVVLFRDARGRRPAT
ncbi:MAG TPA: diguanylate cyclase [Gemmatimonadales bacterium]|nr:diguanylate cyclase [Gemmatimonadales bacterium]